MIQPGIDRAIRSALRQARGARGRLYDAMGGAALTPGERAVLEAAHKTACLQVEALSGLLFGAQTKQRRAA